MVWTHPPVPSFLLYHSSYWLLAGGYYDVFTLKQKSVYSLGEIPDMGKKIIWERWQISYLSYLDNIAPLCIISSKLRVGINTPTFP